MQRRTFLVSTVLGATLMTVAAPAAKAESAEVWDKTFALDERVAHEKVRFANRFGIELAADLYRPKNLAGKLPAIAVSGPFGAVKEQSSGLYAQELAIRGFVTVAFDPSFTGESGGVARNVASPDINAEDFSAAVDYLSLRDDVDPAKIGICGICGWGGFALRAAMMDTRIKATVTSTMYDMCRATGNGYFDSIDAEGRWEMLEKMNAQRTVDAKKGEPARAGGVPDKLPDDAPWFVKDYFDYYKTKRGYHPRSLNSNAGWNVTSFFPFVMSTLLGRPEEIRNAVMLVHGEKAHSVYFSKDVFPKLKGDNKRLLLVPGAVHTDLYDKKDVIPFDEIEKFYRTHLV